MVGAVVQPQMRAFQVITMMIISDNHVLCHNCECWYCPCSSVLYWQ